MTRDTYVEPGTKVICTKDTRDKKVGDTFTVLRTCPGCAGLIFTQNGEHYKREFFEVYDNDKQDCEQVPLPVTTVEKKDVLKHMNIFLVTIALNGNQGYVSGDAMRTQIVQSLKELGIYDDFIKTGGF